MNPVGRECIPLRVPALAFAGGARRMDTLRRRTHAPVQKDDCFSRCLLPVDSATYNPTVTQGMGPVVSSAMPLLMEYGRLGEQAARLAGRMLRDCLGRVQVREKSPADLVTEADVASQQAIKDALLGAFPTHGFLAEENESIPPGADGLRWVVDPLDGTTNFVHGIPMYAVSIGLERAGELLLGVVYDPSADECFVAAAGEGAYLNGQPIAVSRTDELSKAVVAVSFPPRVRCARPKCDGLSRFWSSRGQRGGRVLRL